MAERDHIPLVANLVKDAENYRDSLSSDRIKAIEYYDGKMADMPADKGRSSVVSRDVRATIQKVLPALTRVFLANERIVEYQPAQKGDEEGAEQATDYINSVVFLECNGPRIIEESIHDALKLRNAVIEWEYEEKQCARVSEHSGLDDMGFNLLVAEDGVEVLEHTARVEVIEGQKIPVHDCKIKRMSVERKPRVSAVPLEEFLIHPDAIDEETASLIGRKRKLRRTDLVAMGYKKDQIYALPHDGTKYNPGEVEDATRRGFIDNRSNQIARELEEIDYYCIYVRIDKDGDGIAELRRMCFGGQITAECMLEDEEADEAPMAIIKAKTRPHQWEGISLADDLMDIQRMKTALVRQTLDNLYWQNNQQIAYRADLIEPEGMGAVTNPEFGQGIPLKPGATAAEAIQPVSVPFIAEKSFGMLEYLDNEASDRTGVNDASGGLAPDALQNMTAKGSAMIEQQGIGQTELMARTLAQGFRRMFRGLLRLIIKHQDKPRTVRLRNQWIDFDPRYWNAEMDCTVNTGLGAGTRERDVGIMTMVLSAQKEIIAGYGPDNPYVTPQNLGNALFKLIEASGLKTPDMYFSKPSDEQVAQMKQAMANKPDPEMMKIQAQTQADMQMKRMDMEAAAFKEQVQGQAAVEESRLRAEIEAKDKAEDRALKKYEIDTKAQLELLKLEKQQAFDKEQAMAATQGNPLDRERMVMEFEQKRELAEREFLLKRDMAYADAALRAQQGMAKENADSESDTKEAGQLDAVLSGFTELANSIREVGGAIIQSNTRPKTVKTPDGRAYSIG